MRDDLNFQVAQIAMGYLHAEYAAGRGHLYQLESELPSLSRPLYECMICAGRYVRYYRFPTTNLSAPH